VVGLGSDLQSGVPAPVLSAYPAHYNSAVRTAA
jgi:hypothetical protein